MKTSPLATCYSMPHGAGSGLLEREGVAPVLGLHLRRLAIGPSDGDGLRLVVHPHDPGEVLRSRGDVACLRQPHEEADARKRVWSHVVEVDAVPNEDVDDSGVEGEAKPTQKEVLEDDHLVFPGLRVDVRLRWNPPEARRENSSLLHVFEHGQCHLRQPEEGGRRGFALFWIHDRVWQVRRGPSEEKGASSRRRDTKAEGNKSSPQEANGSVPSRARLPPLI